MKKISILIFLVVMVLAGCGVDTKIPDTINQKISKDRSIMKYISGDVQYSHQSVDELAGEKPFEEFTLYANANSQFKKLSDEGKFKVLSKIDNILLKNSSPFQKYLFDCKKGTVCTYESIQLKYKDDTYSFDDLGGDDTNQLSLNGEVVDLNVASEAEEQAKREQAEKDKEQLKENTDLIYYSINRYSQDGKYIVEGKYTLTPLGDSQLQEHNLENRGFNPNLDKNSIVVDTSFFGGAPDGKFDIYCVYWEKGSRQKAVSVGLAYRNVSRGW